MLRRASLSRQKLLLLSSSDTAAQDGSVTGATALGAVLTGTGRGAEAQPKMTAKRNELRAKENEFMAHLAMALVCIIDAKIRTRRRAQRRHWLAQFLRSGLPEAQEKLQPAGASGAHPHGQNCVED
jgi:hypothetical protein